METGPPRARSGTVLTVVAAAAVVLAAATIVAIAVRAPSEFDQGTPEAVAQGYVQAVIDGDALEAIDHLSTGLRERCTVGELRSAYVPESLRVRLTGVDVLDDRAEVDLAVEEGTGAGLGDGYGYEVTLFMERADRSWVISEAPWPIEYCDEGER